MHSRAVKETKNSSCTYSYIIAPAKEVMFYQAFVCLSVCLFVCLSVCLSVSNFTYKTTERIFMKILREMYL